MINKSLGDYIVDRTESLNDELIAEYFVGYNQDIISRLTDSEQYLLEGSRGIGKTMLMKQAVIKSREDFGKSSILSVWISFEESIRIERIAIVDSEIDPFLQWTIGKILYEVLNAIVKIKPRCIDQLTDRLASIFKTDSGNSSKEKYEKYNSILHEYIQLLEKGDLRDTKSLAEKLPSTELGSILDNPRSFKMFLLELINDFNVERLVLLFDEAAHVFSHSQQEKFFTLFKSLRDPQIACKAAVYPGITNYGKYFEKGQDAKELKLSWSPQKEEDIRYIKKILKVRIQKFDPNLWDKLTISDEIISTICICSNGNPRFVFHIIDELKNQGSFNTRAISMKALTNCIRSVMQTKWKEFDTLSQRLVKYEYYIRNAENLTKNLFIPNLRSWNTAKRKEGKKLSLGFYIATAAYDNISQIFDVLSYSNLISFNNSKKSIGKDQYGYYISMNPAIAFSDLILRNPNELRDVVVAIEHNQAYYATTNEIKLVIDSLQGINEYKCSNAKCDYISNDESFHFCPKCGSIMRKSESESLYKILRSHGVENLKLSDRIIKRLKQKYSTIGEVYDADIDDIQTIPYIKEMRSDLIKNAAIEYMAG